MFGFLVSALGRRAHILLVMLTGCCRFEDVADREMRKESRVSRCVDGFFEGDVKFRVKIEEKCLKKVSQIFLCVDHKKINTKKFNSIFLQLLLAFFTKPHD
jgi:hypothetical protein